MAVIMFDQKQKKKWPCQEEENLSAYAVLSHFVCIQHVLLCLYKHTNNSFLLCDISGLTKDMLNINCNLIFSNKAFWCPSI